MMDLRGKYGLLIDDIPEMRTTVRVQLADAGLEKCDAARNVKEAVERLTQNRYDLVVCDYNLGQGADGQQLLELVRRRQLLPLSTAYLMITGETGYEQVSTAAEYAPDDYLIGEVPSAPQVAASLQSAVNAATGGGEEASPQVAQLMEEMRVIKGLLERQLAGFAWGEMAREAPVKVQLLSELLDAGFAGQSSRRLMQDLPPDLALDDGRKWLRAAVNRRLRTLPAEADFVDQGGVYALVGPTGVGKTTTTAKLAARCVVRYGAERLALLTTDGYRIGAHEQLRIYGRILGVPVFVVRDGEDLRRTLADLRDKHMVIIDTVGMSQRDRMVAEQAAMLTRSGGVNRLLLLNAGSRGDTLDDVVRAYAGEDLAGCILTKVDEAASLAPALDCVVRHGLTLAYVANGQRVPEDLHLPNRNYLLHRAFKVAAAATAHRLSKEEMPLTLSGGSVLTQDPVLG